MENKEPVFCDECDHFRSRTDTHPDRCYEPSNIIYLSATDRTDVAFSFKPEQRNTKNDCSSFTPRTLKTKLIDLTPAFIFAAIILVILIFIASC